jgi:hypothetical protein
MIVKCHNKFRLLIFELQLCANICIQDSVVQIDKRLEDLVAAMETFCFQSKPNTPPPPVAFDSPKPSKDRPPNPVHPIFASPQFTQDSATDDQEPPKSKDLFKRKQHGDTAAPKSDKNDLAIGISDYVLTTLQSASRFSHVPLLHEVATAALSILQGVQVRVQLRSLYRDADICPCRVQETISVVLFALQSTDAI